MHNNSNNKKTPSEVVSFSTASELSWQKRVLGENEGKYDLLRTCT